MIGNLEKCVPICAINFPEVEGKFAAAVAAHELAHTYGIRHEDGAGEEWNLMRRSMSGASVMGIELRFSSFARNKLLRQVANAR
jgi:hypothetical protein